MKKINIISAIILIMVAMPSLFAQNVGIGTAKPLEKLHVAGNIKTDTLKWSIQFTPFRYSWRGFL
jgi:hypothetical protein